MGEIPPVLLAGLAVDRIPPVQSAGLAVDQIPQARSAVSADAATASGCCDSGATNTLPAGLATSAGALDGNRFRHFLTLWLQDEHSCEDCSS